MNQDGNPPPSHLALERAIRLVFLDNWPQVLITLGGIGSTLSSILLGLQEKDRLFWWWMLWLSLLLIIVGSAVSWWRTPGIRSLKERVNTLEDSLQSAEQSYLDLAHNTEQSYFDLFQHQLSILANTALGFDDTERISVYRHDGEAFVMLGRYSKNPEYNERGRVLYPDDAGVIGHAWHSGVAADDNIPDYATVPDEYLQYTRSNWGIAEETARNFTMKSRNWV